MTILYVRMWDIFKLKIVTKFFQGIKNFQVLWYLLLINYSTSWYNYLIMSFFRTHDNIRNSLKFDQISFRKYGTAFCSRWLVLNMYSLYMILKLNFNLSIQLEYILICNCNSKGLKTKVSGYCDIHINVELRRQDEDATIFIKLIEVKWKQIFAHFTGSVRTNNLVHSIFQQGA